MGWNTRRPDARNHDSTRISMSEDRSRFLLSLQLDPYPPPPPQLEKFAKASFRHTGNVVDPNHVDADPDSTYHPDADPDADPDSDFLFDADPDPDPDPSFKKRAQTPEC
jgi:hypothetical protein